MRRELVEAINIQAKREGFYLPIIKAVVFEELSKKYSAKPLNKILTNNRGGSWGEDFLIDGIEAISLRSPDIRHGFIDFQNGEKRYFDKNSFSKFQLKDGDILVIKSNGSLDLVGKSQVFFSNLAYPNVTASNFMMILRPNKKVVTPEYLDAFLKSPQSLIWRVEKQRTTTGLRNLDSKGYLSVKVPLPDSIEAQLQITTLLDKLSKHEFPDTDIINLSVVELASKISNRFNQLLDELEDNKKCLKKLKQSIIQEAIQGKLTEEWRRQNLDVEPARDLLKRIKAEKEKLVKEKEIKKEKPLPAITKDEVPFELPKGWVWCRLGDISSVGTGATPLTSNKEYYEGGTIPWITSSATGKLFVEKPELFITEKALQETNCKVYPSGTLVIAMYGQGKTRGQITELKFDAATNQACATITISYENVHLSRFVKLYFRKIYLEIRELAQGGAQPNLNMGKIKSTIIPLAPLEELKVIEQKVEALLEKCRTLEAEITQSEQHAKMLMQAILKEAFESPGKSNIRELEAEEPVVSQV